MVSKKSKFRTVVLPSVIVVGFAVGLGMAIDEFVASQGVYRTTVWDLLNGRGELPTGRAEVSQQVAIEVCRQKASRELGRNLLLTRFDQRSSRYNGELKVHTVFINLTVKDHEREQVYIRCDISAVNRMIIESRIKGMSGFGFFNS
ncbi:hypothetical protein [Reinekea sp. G2M2-21]|uniref:hypothetical protein n=1 Tax=Reinekea sp. G2M2-21 TaxID=2788942 RepID=UPI0018AB1D5A|nr:hypothetical protein [Reinekea sp. G2M2-21]